MANQQLVDYIKAQLTAGALRPDIHKAAASAGWPVQEIDAAFAAVEGRQAPVAPASIVAQPQVQPQLQTQIKPLPVIHMHPPGGILRSGWFWSFVAVLLLVAVAAGVYFLTPVGAMVQSYLNPPPPAPVVVVPPPPTEQTYVDPTYSFSVTYPAGLLQLPSSMGEVFTLSNFSVSATTSPKQVASCTVLTPKAATTTINGIDFTVQTASTASTTAQMYSTAHAGACVTLKVADPSANSILQSFRFVATSTVSAASSTVQQ